MNLDKFPPTRSGLSVTDLEGELIVFDSATSKAHCLDKTGKAVFLACRDERTFDSLKQELGSDFSEEAAIAALAQLQDLELLEPSSSNMDRRRFLATAGVGMASVLVASVAAPSPVAADSCDTCRINTSENGFLACNCSACGFECGDRFPPSPDGCAPGPEDKGVCSGSNSVCCFEYVIRQNTKTPSSVAAEGKGLYTCRNTNPGGVNFFSPNCQDARLIVWNAFNGDAAFANVQNRPYYCCYGGTGALPRFTC